MKNDDKLTATEGAVLMLLMAEAREIPNSEVTKRYGSALGRESREKLNRLGYLESRTEGRSIVHALGDKGWRLLTENTLEFPDVRPRIVGTALTSLHDALRSRVLPRAGLTRFGELFSQSATVPAATVPAATVPAATVLAQRAEAEPEPVGTGDLGGRIRDVYKSLASEPGAWVSLARLRAQFADVPRAELDEALKRLSRTDGVHLAPESNQKGLTAAEVDAALRSGGQDNHLLAIGV